MTGLGLLVIGFAASVVDAATGRRASRLWRGIPAHIDRRLANITDLGGDD